MDMYLLKFPYRKILQPMAQKMIKVDPDILGYMATVITLGAGACYVLAISNPVLLIYAVALTLLRMTLNTIDGVIAIAQKKDTLTGEIVNALPDRYSDIFLIGGIAISPLCDPMLGIVGLASMFLVSYTGMLGKAVEVEWQHHGPLGKVERLTIIMAASIWQYAQLKTGNPDVILAGFSLTPMEISMVVFAVLGQVAVYNRLQGMLSQINRHEWIKKHKAEKLEKRTAVVYDSATGNTANVARETAEALNADLLSVAYNPDITDYDLVIFATPNIRKYPTSPLRNYLNDNINNIKEYAVIVTWGMPVWGLISKSACFRYFERVIGKKPVGRFSCKGYHVKYKTYKNHPNDLDRLNAFNFGTKLALKIEKESEVS